MATVGSVLIVALVAMAPALTRAGEPAQGAVLPMGKIRTVHADNYEPIVGEGTGEWLIRFFSPTCGVCKDTHKAWEDAVEQIGDESMQFGAVNCLEDPELCRIFNVQWYPTISRLSHNQVYEYPDAPGSIDKIVAFAKSGWVRVNPVVRPKIGDKVKSGPSPVIFVLIPFGCVLALGFAMVRLSRRPRPKKGGLLD